MKSFFSRFFSLCFHPFTLFALGIFFPVTVCFYYWKASSSLLLIEKQVEILHNKVHSVKKKKKREEAFLSLLEKSSPEYVGKELCSLSFLESEIKRTQALLHLNRSDEELQKRLSFLQGKENQLQFKEIQFQKIPPLQETYLEQEHPVEMNKSDLIHLLSKIEQNLEESSSSIPGAPFFWVRSFDLKKKALSPKEEIFVVSFSLLQQELLHE